MRMSPARATILIRGAFLLCLSGSTLHAQVWRNIGPSGTTSPNIRITSVAVDPTNPNRWLVGAVTFAVSDPNIIFAGTGEPGHYGRAHGGVGIMMSTDGGRSWTLVGGSSFARNAVKRIRVHPANPEVVLAATVPRRVRTGEWSSGVRTAPCSTKSTSPSGSHSAF